MNVSAQQAFANAGRNDPCPCGSGKKFKKCCMGKVAAQPAAAAPPPNQLNQLLANASQALNAGKLDHALSFVSQALQLNPRQPDALNLMAYIYMQRQEYPQAEETIRKAISINGKNGLYFLNYAIIMRMQHKYDESLQASHKALAHAPKDYLGQIHLNIANCLQETKNIPESIEAYNKAISASPQLARAYFGRGTSYSELGDKQKMQADFDEAEKREPNNAVTLQKIAAVHIRNKAYPQAITLLEKALQLNPAFEYADILRAQAMLGLGKATEVKALYTQLIAKYPHNTAIKLNHAFVMPDLYASNEEIDQWRDTILSDLDALIAESPILEKPEEGALQLPFYQGYHGRDNTAFMAKLAQAFASCCPSLHFTAPHCAGLKLEKETLRIGFLSESFDSTLLTQFYGEMIEQLAAKDEFDVIIFAHTGSESERVQRMASHVNKYVKYPTHVASAQQVIAAEELDILIYLDIGMHMMSYLLAFARLAPMQAVLHGHPITSGVPTIDYYFSTDAMEPDNAQDHYTEKLIRFERNYSIFQQRDIPEGTKTREELGLPTGDVRLYSCPAMLFRLHPDMDDVFKDILEKDEKAHIILFGKEQTSHAEFLQKRFEKHIGKDNARRITIMPYAIGDDFFHCLRAMDAIMDPLHFSFGTTVFLALGTGIPFVTWKAPFMRGLAATYHYNKMGITDLVANTHKEYTDKLIKLANDKAFYEKLREKILEKNDVMLQTHDITNIVADKIKSLYKEQIG